MKTSIDQLVVLSQIGASASVGITELLNQSTVENVELAKYDEEKVLFIGIDFQNDFMEKGALAVPGAHKDIKNVTRFLYENLHKITNIAVSLDTHEIEQIFHPCWWINESGEHPAPFTMISAQDVENGVWKAVDKQQESLDYVSNIEMLGKKQLCIWPYHCIEGTIGAALEEQFAKIIHFHSKIRQSPLLKIVKGKDPLSEMYGMIKPEYDRSNYCNTEFLERIKGYDKIIIAGEAKSHCVLESVRQIVEHFADDIELTSKIFLLEDCMSSIPGFEQETQEMFDQFVSKYGVHIVQSTNFSLST